MNHRFESGDSFLTFTRDGKYLRVSFDDGGSRMPCDGLLTEDEALYLAREIVKEFDK